jgi:hypothetical protein
MHPCQPTKGIAVNSRLLRRPSATTVLLGATLAVSLAVPATAAAPRPALVSPKAGQVLAVGSQPVFKVRDGSRQARKYKVFLTVSTSKKKTRNGDLERTEIGTFASTIRDGKIFSYQPPRYSFPTWYMNRPGTYYWQAFRIDCSARGCHKHSKIRSFVVR